MKMQGIGLVVAVVTVAVGQTVALDIETVPVGNVGNVDDIHGDHYGEVDYEYNIGTYEVTAGQYTEFLNAVAATDTYGLYNTEMWTDNRGCKVERGGGPGSYVYSVASERADRPVSHVSWGDAARFANWLHNGQATGVQDADTTEDGAYDLSATQQYYGLNGETPTFLSPEWEALKAALLAVDREEDWTWAITSEDEWYKAAYHKNDGDTGNYFDYPTSSDTAPGYVNNDGNLTGTGDPFTEGGTDPGNYATYDLDAWIGGVGGPYYRTEVGEWENSDSPYGTFDQGGNVWEWHEAILYGSFRGMRGGSYTSIIDSYLRAYYQGYGRYPSDEYNNIGFRVAEVPEPATLSLLALGGVALIRGRQANWRRKGPGIGPSRTRERDAR